MTNLQVTIPGGRKRGLKKKGQEDNTKEGTDLQFSSSEAAGIAYW